MHVYQLADKDFKVDVKLQPWRVPGFSSTRAVIKKQLHICSIIVIVVVNEAMQEKCLWQALRSDWV